MKTAVLNASESNAMMNLKLFSYLFNPKIFGAVLLLDLSGILSFITKYVFEDITFLKFLVVACIIDLITGIWKVIVTEGIKKVTSKGLRDSVTKIVSYGSFLIITHVLTHFEVNGVANKDFLWLNKVAFEFLILIEIKSVYENIIKINSKLDFISDVLSKVGDLIKKKKDEIK